MLKGTLVSTSSVSIFFLSNIETTLYVIQNMDVDDANDNCDDDAMISSYC